MKRTGAVLSKSVQPPKKKGSGSSVPPWQMKLLESMKNPDMVVKSDERTVIIKDAYPKARHHYLALPRLDIPSLKALKRDHVELLEKLLENGKVLTEELKSKDSSLKFKYGYHASPSMARLHMHVISLDFDSDCLKNKKHWNSFNTDFFLDAEKVISILRDMGKVELDVKGVYEPLLKMPLRCHVCCEELQNMPKLKAHIARHF